VRGLVALSSLCIAMGCRARPTPGDVGVSEPPREASATSAKAAPPRAGGACSAEAVFACEGDTALRCDGGTWAKASACGGPSGCSVDVADDVAEAGRVRCDDSIAREGDACDTPHQAACSMDGGAELACKEGTFVRVRVCKEPCVVAAAAPSGLSVVCP
jgi:hypothetical protein